MPESVRAAHELCFFLHDECVRALAEYEGAGAHRETIRFENTDEFVRFEELAASDDAITALRKLGYHHASKRVVLNTISIAMISDCLHHVYEALACFEKRKCIVGFNLLRKPLKESLLYLSWMYGRQDEFYDQFTIGDSKYLSQSRIGSDRIGIFSDAINRLSEKAFFDSGLIDSLINDRRNTLGFELFFQHSVHLVTIKYPELRTDPENFNFIFKNPQDDDLYDLIYFNLPYLILLMSHVIMSVFNRMREMDDTSRVLFEGRSIIAYSLIVGREKLDVLRQFRSMMPALPRCSDCKRECKVTLYNAVRMLLASELRCVYCRRKNVYLTFSFPEHEH